MTPEVIKAFDHVKSFFPTVSMVVFDKDGRWQYFGEDYKPLKFKGKKIRYAVLEDAVDSLTTLPYIYQP